MQSRFQIHGCDAMRCAGLLCAAVLLLPADRAAGMRLAFLNTLCSMWLALPRRLFRLLLYFSDFTCQNITHINPLHTLSNRQRHAARHCVSKRSKFARRQLDQASMTVTDRLASHTAAGPRRKSVRRLHNIARTPSTCLPKI